MPHPWAMVDSNFPTFTGEESPREQTRQIVEYMMLLTEALKYQLENLDTNNWNKTALQTFQTDTTQDVENQAENLTTNMIQLANELTNLSSRVTALESLTARVTQVETDVAYLEQWQAEMENQIGTLQEQLGTTQGDIDTLEQDVAELQDQVDSNREDIDSLKQTVQQNATGSATIGKEGRDLYLVGNVYINGILFE